MINIYEYLINKQTKEKDKDPNNPRTWGVGDILVATYGYNMTLNRFYRITKIVGKASFELEELASKLTDGSYNHPAGCHEVPIENKVEGTTKGRIGKSGRLKIDGYLASLWNGKPVYANHCD